MYHIVLSQAVDLVAIDRAAQAGHRPRHVMGEISQRLGAIVHQPGQDAVSPLDRLGAKLIGQPQHWALARRLVAQLTDDDTVFCLGEAVGLPLAMLCKLKGILPKLAVSVMAPERARVYGVLKLFQLDEQIECFLTDTHIKRDALGAYMYLTHDRVVCLPEPIDVQFFQPGAAQPHARPTIVSASVEPSVEPSLEQREAYQTLAAVTQDLEAEVKLCAVSPPASASQDTPLPQALPAHITTSYASWSELVQLYRQADVVVVSLLDDHTSAELIPLMAALACRRPVVVTRTPGLAEELIDLGIVTGVNPGDAVGLQDALMHLLSHPELAAAQAHAGYEHMLSEHASDRYVETLMQCLQNLGDRSQSSALARLFASPNTPVAG